MAQPYADQRRKEVTMASTSDAPTTEVPKNDSVEEKAEQELKLLRLAHAARKRDALKSQGRLLSKAAG